MVRSLGPIAFWEMLISLVILVLGLAYAWRRDALGWV